MVRGLVHDLKLWIKKHGLKTTKEFLSMGSITNLKENKTLFMQCDCKSEVLVIEYDHYLNIADFAIYRNDACFKHSLSLWQKIRNILQIIWHGRTYGDQIVLNTKQLKEIKSFLCSLDL